MAKNRILVANEGNGGIIKTEIDVSDVVQSHLNDLISLNRGIVNVYQTASERVEEKNYAVMLQSYAKQHQNFVIDLINCVVSYSGNPTTTVDAGSIVKQTWISLKAVVTDGDGPILGEVARDTQTVLDAYGETMSAHLPESVRDILRRHISVVRINYEKLSALEAALTD